MWEEHIKKTERVFQRLKSTKLVINLSNSDFSKAEVKYLGHIVGYWMIAPTEAKPRDILKHPSPKNIKGVRRFLRNLCKDFSGRTAPLTDLIRKGNRFCWTDECQEAFGDIKKSLSC